MEEKKGFSDEVNMLDYLKVILKNKWLIFTIVCVSVVATAISSLLMQPVYEAKAGITHASQQNSPSGMSFLAAQFGISAPASASVTELVNLLNSNILRENIIKEYKLLPIFFGKETSKKQSENERIWAGLRFFHGAMKVNFKQKANIIELSMQFKDPQMAAEILNYTLTELNNHISNEAKRVADTNKKYLESLLNDTADPFIKNKIYNIIAEQIEQSMMAEVKENFAFKVLDPPRVPDKRIKPKRMLMVTFSFMASLFGGIFVAFLKEYVDKIRNDKSRKI